MAATGSAVAHGGNAAASPPMPIGVARIAPSTLLRVHGADADVVGVGAAAARASSTVPHERPIVRPLPHDRWRTRATLFEAGVAGPQVHPVAIGKRIAASTGSSLTISSALAGVA